METSISLRPRKARWEFASTRLVTVDWEQKEPSLPPILDQKETTMNTKSRLTRLIDLAIATSILVLASGHAQAQTVNQIRYTSDSSRNAYSPGGFLSNGYISRSPYRSGFFNNPSM